jgi:hypothetical protein
MPAKTWIFSIAPESDLVAKVVDQLVSEPVESHQTWLELCNNAIAVREKRNLLSKGEPSVVEGRQLGSFAGQQTRHEVLYH